MRLSTQVKWNHVHVPSQRCRAKHRQRIAQGRTYNVGLAGFLRAEPQRSIRKDSGRGVGAGGGGGRPGWNKVRKKDEQRGKWNEMRTGWAEGGTAQSDSSSSGRPVCHGSLRLMDTFSPCQGRLQRKVLPVGTVGRCETCGRGVGVDGIDWHR